MANFPWSDSGSKWRIPLARLNLIFKSVKKAGWGILNFRSFNLALLVSNLWQIFGEKGFWKTLWWWNTSTVVDLRSGYVRDYHRKHVYQQCGEAFRLQSHGLAVILFGLLAMDRRYTWGWMQLRYAKKSLPLGPYHSCSQPAGDFQHGQNQEGSPIAFIIPQLASCLGYCNPGLSWGRVGSISW